MRPGFYIFLLLTFFTLSAHSQDNIQFIENKGQWNPQVKYMGLVPGGAFYIHEDGFTVVQHDSKDLYDLTERRHGHATNANMLNDLVLKSHAYRMRFLNGKKATIVADKPLFTYANYFIGDDPSKWASNCRIFQGITIKDVYPNVDVRYYSNNGTLKYDMIVHPGGDVKKIALRYDGVDKLQVRSKELVLRTSVGDMRELQPYSYQFKVAGKEEVDVGYLVEGNTVRFKARNVDASSTLIIDPAIVFCSFSGSRASNWGMTATYGPDGSMYGGGIVFGEGFPVSPGAYQNNFGGGNRNCPNNQPFDISIIKLSPDGSQRIYATYIGGSGDEMPQSLIVDPQGNLVIAGRTNSPNYPTTGALMGPGGSWDIVLTKLNATGTGIIGSRRIGGSGDDGANIAPCSVGATSLQRNYGDYARSEVNLDGAGNIYLASCTQSNNFPTVNPFQGALGGLQDGVVLKFNSNLSTCLFSSYFGGDKNDAAYVLSINPLNGDIYIAGGTESQNLPGIGGNVISAAHNGIIDGFVSIIAPDGSAIKKTTYLGTAGIDQVYGIQFDWEGYPYVMGQTQGSWPIINAAWSQPNGRQFISKLQPDLSAYVYSTCFGKGEAAPDMSPVAFLVDRCENVYISGWGGTVATGYPSAGVGGLPITPDAFKPNTDASGQDFYFFVLKKNATGQLFGSFFGQNGGQVGDHVDGGTSRFSPDGVIYQAICANCYGGTQFPTTPGAWAITNGTGSSGCNLAMVKIAFNLDGVRGGLQSFINGVRDTTGCLPLTVQFRDSVQIAKSYEWYFGDGSPMQTSTTGVIDHQFNRVGTFQVMMVAIDPDKCVVRDTSYLRIGVSDVKAMLDFNINKLNPCDSFKYRFDNLSTGSVNFTSQSFIWDFGDNTPRVTTGNNAVFHNYAAPGTYTVKMLFRDINYCNKVDSVVKQLRVAALVKARFETPETGCVPYTARFTNTSDAGSSFQWSFGDGSTSTASSPTHTYTIPGVYTVKLVVTDTATCNIIDSTSQMIHVFSNPTADFNATPQPPSINTPISFENLSSPDAIRFLWEFGDGDTLWTNNRNVVQHEFNATKTYTVCLTAFNQPGCPARVCKDVDNMIENAVDVPNAFTPGSGDINSRVFVRGFGIAKMKFTIWARWGEKVFETDDKRIGWDGRYKGQLLPMDVYAYTLDVQFSDGKNFRKTGDITLIR